MRAVTHTLALDAATFLTLRIHTFRLSPPQVIDITHFEITQKHLLDSCANTQNMFAANT